MNQEVNSYQSALMGTVRRWRRSSMQQVNLYSSQFPSGLGECVLLSSDNIHTIHQKRPLVIEARYIFLKGTYAKARPPRRIRRPV